MKKLVRAVPDIPAVPPALAGARAPVRILIEHSLRVTGSTTFGAATP